MREMPHGRNAINYLNAIEEVLLNENDIKDIIEIEEFLLEYEKKAKEPKTINEKLAVLGMELSDAVFEKKTQSIKLLKNNFMKLAECHPKKNILKNIPEIIEEHSVPGYCYRNWKGTKEGINFGVIEAKLKNDAIIGIIGDWGTGDPDAKALLYELKGHKPDIIIHLGDIYRSCRYDKDVVPNFINIFNEVYDESKGEIRPPILTIAGNHDYMSKGGKGFYKLLDTVNNKHPKWQQKASYFCLRTDNMKWQFLGADTGINDPSYTSRNSHPGLEPDEYTWHFNKMNTFDNKNKGRTIFMTHHPLFSATHPLQNQSFVNEYLATNFSNYLTLSGTKTEEIRLWMWGHNHWFIPYVNTVTVKNATLDKGRLIGGSARHDYHSTSEIVNSGKHVINYTKNGNKTPLVPDSNNGLPNHTYTIIKLSDTDTEVTHYQTPSWHTYDNNPIKTLPNSQSKIILKEYILDTKPAEKYPNN